MDVQVALRVVRGPDWRWTDQDGGEGHVGTVVEVKEGESGGKVAVVQWDCGNRGQYSCGVEGKYDLRVLDNAQIGLVQRGISCDACVQTGLTKQKVTGMRWKCASCHDYDLCTECYMKDKHNTEHRFVRYDTNHSLRAVCPPRLSSGDCKFTPCGLFPGGEVVRGQDWACQEEDGGDGSVGKITVVKSWDKELANFRSAVEVEWPNKNTSKCRTGHEGKVDVKCTKPGSLFQHYMDHLPVLGAALEPIGPRDFVVGDLVQVELDVDTFEMMQEGHGGWVDIMAEIRNRIGIIHAIDADGDLRVSYEEKVFTINPEAVIKVECPRFAPGDVIRVMDDREEMVKLQKGFGGWNEDMTDILGHLGAVRGIGNSAIHIVCRGKVLAVNPLAVKPADDVEDEDERLALVTSATMADEDDDGDEEDSEPGLLASLRLQMLLLKTIDTENSDILGLGAILDDKEAVTAYLQKFPNDVNAKYKGKTALHFAVNSGNIAMIKILIDYSASLDDQDDDNLAPLHICSGKGMTEAVKLLMENGADPNVTNEKGHTPLITASGHGHPEVVALLVKYPKINLCAQDNDGDTALHIAVHMRELECIRELMKAKADPTCVNFKLDTPMHVAAHKGFHKAIEEMVQHHPEAINVQNDEGCTALHLASGLNKREIVSFLLQQPSIDIEARTHISMYTPLHGAIIKGASEMVELLVEHGADVNVKDGDGETPLHLICNNKTAAARALAPDTPKMLKIKEELVERYGAVEGYVVVACYLISAGADINQGNDTIMGTIKPLDLCSPQHKMMIEAYVQSRQLQQKKNSQEESEEGRGSGEKVGERDKNEETQSEEDDGDEHRVINQPALGTPHGDKSLSPEPASSLPSSPLNPLSQRSPNPATGGTKNASTPHNEEAPLCILCDSPITIKMVPCGHTVVCSLCARRARKCLQCKSPVVAVVNLDQTPTE